MHTIQAVADRTGLTPDVIRVWEKRHQAVRPVRTTSNQRNYSDDDIERLLLFRKLTERGLRISNIAALSTPDLLALLQKEERQRAPALLEPVVGDAQGSLVAALDAIKIMDAARLETVLQKVAADVGMVAFLTQFAGPLVENIGEQWRSGTIRTCQEHFCSAYLRSFLGRFLLDANPSATGPRLVVATPPGQFHELGAVMVAVVASQCGWQPLYLGASVPAEELLFCARIKNAKAIALSVTYPSDDPQLPGLLTQLRQQLPSDVALISGGACMPCYRLPAALANLYRPGDLASLSTLLTDLRMP